MENWWRCKWSLSIKMQMNLSSKDTIDFCPVKKMIPNTTILLSNTVLHLLKVLFQHSLSPIYVYLWFSFVTVVVFYIQWNLEYILILYLETSCDFYHLQILLWTILWSLSFISGIRSNWKVLNTKIKLSIL